MSMSMSKSRSKKSVVGSVKRAVPLRQAQAQTHAHAHAQTFQMAARCAGCTVPAGGERLARACKQFDALVYSVALRVIDLLRIVATTKTLQPENLQTLVRVAAIMRAPVGDHAVQSTSRGFATARSRAQRGGNGTVMTGAFFDQNNPADAVAVGVGHDGSYGHDSFPGGSDIIRDALPHTFPNGQSGGSGSDAWQQQQQESGLVNDLVAMSGGSGSSGRPHWLSDEGLTTLLRDYRAAGATSSHLRVAEGLRPALRSLVEANVVSAMRAAALVRRSSSSLSSSSRSSSSSQASKCMSAERLAKAASVFRIELPSRLF
jgi:hypothetical protein